MVEPNKNFVTFLTLFLLSFSLLNFLLLFGVKLLFMLFMLLTTFPFLLSKIKTPYERLFGSPPNYYHLHSFGFADFVLLQPHEHNKLEPQSSLFCFFGYGETQKGYRCYDPISHHFRISCNVVFWEHHSFVELSHFHASLSTFSVLDLFPDKPHIPFIVFLNPPIDFSVQPLDIFYASPGSPFNK